MTQQNHYTLPYAMTYHLITLIGVLILLLSPGCRSQAQTIRRAGIDGPATIWDHLTGNAVQQQLRHNAWLAQQSIINTPPQSQTPPPPPPPPLEPDYLSRPIPIYSPPPPPSLLSPTPPPPSPPSYSAPIYSPSPISIAPPPSPPSPDLRWKALLEPVFSPMPPVQLPPISPSITYYSYSIYGNNEKKPW